MPDYGHICMEPVRIALWHLYMAVLRLSICYHAMLMVPHRKDLCKGMRTIGLVFSDTLELLDVFKEADRPLKRKSEILHLQISKQERAAHPSGGFQPKSYAGSFLGCIENLLKQL